MRQKRLGEILLENGKITEEQIKQAIDNQKGRAERIGSIFIKQGWVSETDIINALSEQFDIPVFNIQEHEINTSFTQNIPAKFSYHYKIAPITKKDSTLFIAISDPLNLPALDDLSHLLGCKIKPMLCTDQDILKILKKIYGIGGETMEEMAVSDVLVEQEQEDETDDTDASMTSFVNHIIRDAYRDGATDIHLEPFENDLIVRYRIDGVLHQIPTPLRIKKFQSSILSRIKIMASMNIAENRLPQDGRIKFNIGNENIDMRVSTLPTMYGESIDLRILPRSQVFLGLEQLGLSQKHQEIIEKLIKKPHGILLVTGPTGHGKTTTLYACLSRINSQDKKIITVEDPVEYRVKGINQVPVHAKIGLTFANGLRSILRQDPDIIMVGEIRDQETAEIAIRASLTGHLVFSTLHTNDAAGAVTRLKDMGIEPYLLASSIEAVLAQRLVRLVCPECKVEDNPEKVFLERIGLNLSGQTIYKAGAGCEKCRHTGYKGRTGIYELLALDDDLRELIVEASGSGLKKQVVSKGMTTLRASGWEKVKQGITTIEEILRATQEEDIL